MVAPTHVCPHCSYDLSGSTLADPVTCPECGREFPLDFTERRPLRVLPPRRRRGLFWLSFLGLILMFGLAVLWLASAPTV